MKYQLLLYKDRNDLSQQAIGLIQVLDNAKTYDEIYGYVNNLDSLEFESIQILKRGILAGYTSSIYTYNWKYSNEVQFWILVNSKSKEIGLSYLILANLKRKEELLEQVIPLYFKSFELENQHVFSLEDKIRDEIFENMKYKYDLLNYIAKGISSSWNKVVDEEKIEDFEYWYERFRDDAKALKIFNNYLNLEK